MISDIERKSIFEKQWTSVQVSVPPDLLPPVEPSSPFNWRLLVTLFIAAVFNVNNGGYAGYLSPALPDLNDHRNPFHMTDDELSWAASLLGIGSMAGGLGSGPFCDLLGRKVALMASSLAIVVGYTVVAAATDARYLYAGITIVGIFGTINMSAILIYTSEVTPAKIRGSCMSLTMFAYSIGLVLSYAMGIPLSWNWLAIFLAALIAAPNLVLAFLPESPYWFLMKGKREAAIHGVTWFQGACDLDEIGAIEQSLQDRASATASNWKDLVVDADNRKSLFIVTMLFIFGGISGNLVLQIYTVSIFQLAGVSSIAPNVQTIIVGLCGVVGSAICPLLVDRIGRRLTLLFSTVISALSMAAVAIFFQVLEAKPDYALERLFWLPVAAISVSNFGYMLGLVPVPFILSCEMLPTNVRGCAQTVFMVIQGFGFFVGLKSFIYIYEAINNSGVFYVYTGVCVASTLFVIVFVSENEISALR